MVMSYLLGARNTTMREVTIRIFSSLRREKSCERLVKRSDKNKLQHLSKVTRAAPPQPKHDARPTSYSASLSEFRCIFTDRISLPSALNNVALCVARAS